MVYVVDTSVLLSDPKALERLQSNHVVIPLIVLIELEYKKNHPDLGFAARSNLRILESFRKIGDLTKGIDTEQNGSIRIELDPADSNDLPDFLSSTLNDNKILAIAFQIKDSILLSKDLPMRLKAAVAGIKSEDYLDSDYQDSFWNKTPILQVEDIVIDDLYSNTTVTYSGEYPENTGVILRSYNSSALAKIQNNKLNLIKDRNVFEIRGRSAEQRIAIDLLTDKEIGIVSVGGPAGTGKSILALAAGLESVLESRQHKKVIIFRPLYSVGGQDLGFLPGTAEEKMSPWAAAVFDALQVFCGSNVIEQVVRNNLLEVLPLTHIRGRTLSDSYVIIDEAQNLEKMVLLTALSRIGQNSKVILTHDVAQRDNLRVGKHDGIASVVSSLTGNSLFAHIALSKSERSPIAELVSSILEE